jgi:hypothetical protein
MPDDLLDSETVLARFNRLLQDVLQGSTRRNTFLQWEVDLLLDIDNCRLRDTALKRELQRYRNAVQRHMGRGERLPPKFSDFLQSRPGAASRAVERSF